jgi:subtilisin
MNSNIQTQLKATGVAQVMVFLKDPSAADGHRLAKCFTHRETGFAPQMAAAAAERAGGGAAARRVRLPSPMRIYHHLGIVLGTVEERGLAALKSNKQVGKVTGVAEWSLIRPHARAAATPTRRVTWGIGHLGADQVWARGFDGSGVLAGHLDTGVDGSHGTLRSAIRHYAVFDDFGDEVLHPGPPRDTEDHGTHTAGTIAGRPVSLGSSTVHIGVAPGCALASATVIEGGNVVARVLGGMDWALGKGCRILSMSLGLRGFTEDFLELTRLLRRRGVLPVFAVGNEGAGRSRSPGNYSEALSVGAHDDTPRVARFSCSQRFLRPQEPIVPDLVAPGVNVISAKPGGGFQSMDGTSMATPHVAGLAALLMQARPEAGIDLIESAIFGSCVRPATLSVARTNRGMPNALRALQILLGSGTGGPGAKGAKKKTPKKKAAPTKKNVKSRPGRK